MWDPKSPFHDPRVRKAVSLAIDRKLLSEADTLGASKPNGNLMPKGMEFAVTIEPDPYDPAQAKKLLAEAGYPNGFDAGDLYPIPPYFATGEAIVNYLGAVGIRARLRTMERAAFYSALGSKKLKGLCFCSTSIQGNASTRLAAVVPSDSTYAYGGWPDVRIVQEAAERNRPREARRGARRDPADAARARALRADLGLLLAERGRTSGRRRGADEDRPVSVVGAAGGSAAEAEIMPS